ncbi:MAG: biotin/lipoyl-binding protein [Proteobacteria bacterium]|nr:biotin/lipoyl-binding protein [Pseudomonadota bacterium]
MTARLQLNGTDHSAEIIARRPGLVLRIGAVEYAIEEEPATGAEFALNINGVRHRGWRCRVHDTLYVRLEGRTYALRVPSGTGTAEGAETQDEVRASMPGVVVAVHCNAGQAVETGDRLLTLESMKLQMTVVASHAARVAAIHVSAESTFERGALLVSFERESPKP